MRKSVPFFSAAARLGVPALLAAMLVACASTGSNGDGSASSTATAGPTVIATTEKPDVLLGGIAGFVESGLELSDEPEAVPPNTLVDPPRDRGGAFSLKFRERRPLRPAGGYEGGDLDEDPTPAEPKVRLIGFDR